MQQLSIQLPDRLVERLQKIADDLDTDVSLTAGHILTRALQQVNTRSAIMQDRGQRQGAQTDPRLDWWREARFGMFIHWGLYAIPAGVWKGETIPGIGEWIMYRAEIPVAEYEQLADAVQPGQVRRRGVGLAGQAGGPKVHGHHRQAPRRLLPVQVRRRPTTTSWTPRPLAAIRSRSWPRNAPSRASSSASTTPRPRTGIIPTATATTGTTTKRPRISPAISTTMSSPRCASC